MSDDDNSDASRSPRMRLQHLNLLLSNECNSAYADVAQKIDPLVDNALKGMRLLEESKRGLTELAKASKTMNQDTVDAILCEFDEIYPPIATTHAFVCRHPELFERGDRRSNKRKAGDEDAIYAVHDEPIVRQIEERRGWLALLVAGTNIKMKMLKERIEIINRMYFVGDSAQVNEWLNAMQPIKHK